MPKFIKTNTIVEVNRHGIETDRQVLFTEDEVVARVLLNPSLIIEVTESHAVQVVRPQGRYQEISEDTLETIEDKRAEGADRLGSSIILTDTVETELDAEDVGEVAAAEAGEDDADDEAAPLTFGKGK